MEQAFIKNNLMDLESLFSFYSNRIALITEAERLTFQDLKRHLAGTISAFEQIDIPKGHHVGLYHENSFAHILMMLASWLMDFIYIPLNFKTPLDQMLSWIDLDTLFSETVLPHAYGIASYAPGLILTKKIITDAAVPFDSIGLDQEASIIFTSGSTGIPSGVLHTVGNYVYSALGTIEFLELTEKDTWLVSLPMYHVGGLLIFIRTFLSGSTCILPAGLKQVEASIRQFRPSVVSLVPTQLLRFMESPETRKCLQSSKAILLGGAPAPTWLIDHALDMKLPIIPTYGSTEGCAQITGVLKDAQKKDFYTSGKILPYREISIDQDNAVWVGGKTLFKCYIKQKNRFYPFKNGKFKTSDIGKFDDKGNLVVLGRSDQVFISGGENINPFEIERSLMTIDHITTAIVVPVPHKEFGNVPWAFVETAAPLDPEKIKMQLKELLPAYKHPKKILFLSPEDKGEEMKYKRKVLQEKAETIAGGPST